MNDKDLDKIRKEFFSDVEEGEEETVGALSFKDLFGEEGEAEEAPEEPAAASAGTLTVEVEKREEELTPEEKDALALSQIRRWIAQYRYELAEAERRIGQIRNKLVGLETEYRAIIGEGAPAPAPAPAPDPPPPSGEPRKTVRDRAAARRSPAAWNDAQKIDLEEAAWRILTEQGKSMPLWRIASAIRRKGYTTEFSESSLGAMVRKSSRLGFTGEGHIYIK